MEMSFNILPICYQVDGHPFYIYTISTPPWSDDEYLLSSLFRDFFNEGKSVGKSLNINIPEPIHYSGKQYFSPFALGILSILKKLTRGG